jgi:hypothetical protein
MTRRNKLAFCITDKLSEIRRNRLEKGPVEDLLFCTVEMVHAEMAQQNRRRVPVKYKTMTGKGEVREF